VTPNNIEKQLRVSRKSISIVGLFIVFLTTLGFLIMVYLQGSETEASYEYQIETQTFSSVYSKPELTEFLKSMAPVGLISDSEDTGIITNKCELKGSDFIEVEFTSAGKNLDITIRPWDSIDARVLSDRSDVVDPPKVGTAASKIDKQNTSEIKFGLFCGGAVTEESNYEVSMKFVPNTYFRGFKTTKLLSIGKAESTTVVGARQLIGESRVAGQIEVADSSIPFGHSTATRSYALHPLEVVTFLIYSEQRGLAQVEMRNGALVVVGSQKATSASISNSIVRDTTLTLSPPTRLERIRAERGLEVYALFILVLGSIVSVVANLVSLAAAFRRRFE
jgi:hypothetical protein